MLLGTDWELFEWFFWYNKVWPLYFTHIYPLGFLQGLSQVNSRLLSNLGSKVPVGRCPKAWTVPHQVGSRVTRLETKHLGHFPSEQIETYQSLVSDCIVERGLKKSPQCSEDGISDGPKKVFFCFCRGLFWSQLIPGRDCYQRLLHRWVTHRVLKKMQLNLTWLGNQIIPKPGRASNPCLSLPGSCQCWGLYLLQWCSYLSFSDSQRGPSFSPPHML